MRSYYAHLNTVTSPSNTVVSSRPTFRSSAIFPVIQKPGITSRILFMGYWILKRNIREIGTIVTLRNMAGQVLARASFTINSAKTFSIELQDELKRAGLEPEAEFTGSLEIEFFSTQNLVFPFPAVVINYYGPTFSTVVHTAQRIYNDFDDMVKNSQTEVPESGFNIYVDGSTEPFIGLINGCMPVENSTMLLEFINHKNEVLIHKLELGHLAPYETTIVFPAQHCDLMSFLDKMPGAAKVHFQIDWAFPRLVVGNLHHDIPALTITHTYYDCSGACNDSDYWREQEAGWHSLALMLPGEIADNHFTNIYFYPIYSPSSFAIDVEVYNSEGKLLGAKNDIVTIEAPKLEFKRIELQTLCKELKIPSTSNCAIRLIARPRDGSKIPARIKIGFDVGTINKLAPCNICTNLQPFNPALENKPSSFRWSPVLADQPQATLWLMNSSPAFSYDRTAELNITFFREADTQTLDRKITIPPHGFVTIRIHDDDELKNFFQGKVGWMTATTTNPYTTTYYFADNASGVVGGDHGF